MSPIALLSVSIACGIFGFIAGFIVAVTSGLHETIHVMLLGFSLAVVSALIAWRVAQRILLRSAPWVKIFVEPFILLSGPVATWVLFKFVGY